MASDEIHSNKPASSCATPTQSPKEKNLANRIRGAQNRARGLNFEGEIKNACNFYLLKKAALIEKTPEPMKIIRDMGHGQFVACFEKKAQPDFKGCLHSGKTVVFEAKFTSTTEMHADAVIEGQWESLERYYEMGAVCFVVVGFATGGRYRIPWRIWRDMKAHFGRKYFREEDVQEYRLNYSQGALNFLGDTRGEEKPNGNKFE